MIVTGNAKDASDMGMVKETLEILENFYPGWQWLVCIEGGCIIIKSTVLMWMLKEAFIKEAASACMVIKYTDAMSDANHRKKLIMRAGGQLLERAKERTKGRQYGDLHKLNGFDLSMGT